MSQFGYCRLRQIGYGDHPSSCLSFSRSCTTYQLLSRWQISRRVPSPIFTRQLSHTRSSPITHDRDSCHPTSAKGKILPSYHLMPHGLYSPSGLHSTKAVTSLIDFSHTLTPQGKFTNERTFYYCIVYLQVSENPCDKGPSVTRWHQTAPHGCRGDGILILWKPLKEGSNSYVEKEQ